ncbi:MAG: amino acid permease [Desulfobacteraceae bacterium]|jgi:amino acid transporter
MKHAGHPADNKPRVIKDASGSTGGNLGTFAGVFTPSVLTILGIILFLRLGYVTGSAGMGRALIIIAIANVISVLTSQSLAAVATNLRVKGGGDYYLISRTLGHQFGGAIGMVLYLAQSVSVAFYCIGFAEALTAMIPQWPYLSPRVVALIAVGLLFILAWMGADWATRFQYGVMVLLIAALCSFFFGGIGQWEGTLFKSNWSAPANAPPFWIIFGIFFPAVTGFTQGVSMSGDLKDPGKSLPLGTFAAVGVSIVVYFAVAVTFAGVLPNKTLMGDYQAIKQVARYGFLIDAGVIAATLSSAMASFLGGPRILQSLSADRIFPFLTPFAKSSGKTGNPRRAILLTLAIALATIGLGQLNLVARVVSMFFLISYGLLNYATYYEAHAESPSFRPRFKWFNKYLSLLGCFICLGIILALDVKNGLIAMAILIAIHQYLKQTAGPARWADSSSAHAFQVIRKQLSALANSTGHHRNWRPHILAFTNHAERRTALLTFGQWIEGQSGLITAVRIIEGSDLRLLKFQKEAQEELQRHIQKNQMNIFPLVVRTDDVASSLPVLLQSYGVGQLTANTVLINWYGQSGKGVGGLQTLKYGHNLRSAFRLGFNLVILHYEATRWQTLLASACQGRRIDVWWRADATSRLMLLFAYLTTRHHDWEKAEIRVLTSGTGERLADVKEELNQLLEDVRIDAQACIVSDLSPETVISESSKSSLVFMPFRIRQFRLTDMEGFSLARTLPKLPPTALIMAAEDIDLDAEPEEGSLGALAEAMDKLREAERKMAKSSKTHERAKKAVDRINDEIQAAIANGLSKADLDILKAKLVKADEDAETAFRKAAKDKAKADDAAAEVKKIDDPSTHNSQ